MYIFDSAYFQLDALFYYYFSKECNNTTELQKYFPGAHPWWKTVRVPL